MIACGVALALALALPGGIADDLYGHRLLFDAAGRPVVSIGMMQSASRVTVESPKGLVVVVANDKGDELRTEIAANTPLVVERVSGTAARTSDVLVIETLEADERARRRDVAAAWTKKGVTASIVDVGGVYGVKGTVVDNRAALIVAPPAQKAMLEKLGARPVLVERLVDRPDALPSGSLKAGGLVGASARITSKSADGALLVRDVEHGIGYADHGFADRTLRGELVVLFDKKGTLAVVNLVDEDAVVGGVLPSEMFATAPMEALKAQAVTARGELFSKINRRHFADPHLVCSEQHCQVYKGMTAEHPRATQAAEATRGELAFVDGRVIPSVYSACCGGHTEAADAVWDQPPHSALGGRVDAAFADPSARPWLVRSVEGSALFASTVHNGAVVPGPRPPLDLRSDDAVRAFLALPRDAAFCGKSTFNQKGDAWRWERRFDRAALDAAFADLGVGEVKRVAVEDRGPGGRLRALVVEGSKKTARVLRELPVRRRLGNLRSGLFVVDEERSAGGSLVAVTFRGAGFGHGSGMCQQGAIGMAEAGHDYRAILRHYYAGAEVKRVF